LCGNECKISIALIVRFCYIARKNYLCTSWVFGLVNLSQWSSNVNDSGDLSASDSADYWGLQGLSAVIDDNTAIYAQDDTPNNETQYRTRFYVNPTSITMATGDILDLFTGRNGTTDVVRIQLQ